MTCFSVLGKSQEQDRSEQSLATAVPLAPLNEFAKIEELLKAKQVNDAVTILLQLIESGQNELVALPASDDSHSKLVRYVSVQQRCQLFLAACATSNPEVLQRYRARVDSKARIQLQRAAEENDLGELSRIVKQLFCSRYGDDASLLLGECFLEQGEFSKARNAWRAISPELTERLGFPQQLPNGLLLYPDTDIARGKLVARMVYVSIMQGEYERAKIELASLSKMTPRHSGTFFGKNEPDVDVLQELLADRTSWKAEIATPDWRTFAGSATRAAVSTADVDPAGNPNWSIQVRRRTSLQEIIGESRPRVGEDTAGLLSYHPIVVDGKVFWSELSRIRGVDLATGRPAWRPDDNDAVSPLNRALIWEHEDSFARPQRHRGYVGVPRFTMSSHGSMLFARLGSPITGPRKELTNRGQLVGFDLNRQGSLLPGFPIYPPERGWEFDGCPVSDGNHLYVVLRHSSYDSARVEMHVACYPLYSVQISAPPEPIWQVKICEADSVSLGRWEEVTHTLLTLSENTLFCNTNLGVISSIECHSGALNWSVEYPRKPFRLNEKHNDDLHYFRDLNPPVVDRQKLFVTPSDSDEVLALDLSSGAQLWRQAVPRSTHILGIGKKNLMLGGDQLLWLDSQTGQFRGMFPGVSNNGLGQAGKPAPRGVGRGLLAQDKVYWPTREAIYVFDQQTYPIRFADQRDTFEPRLRRRIDLGPRGLKPGNLLAVPGMLVISGAESITGISLPTSKSVKK